MRRYHQSIILIGLAAALSAGCNNTIIVTPGTPTLSAIDKTAIAAVSQSLQDLGEALGPLIVNTDPDAGPEGEGFTVDGCPAIEVSRTLIDARINIAIDFGAGCSGQLTHNDTYAGLIRVTVLPRDGSVLVQFDDFFIASADLAFGGTLEGEIEYVAGDPRTVAIQGNLDITISDGRRITGAIGVILSDEFDILIDSLNLTVELDDGTAYNVTGADVYINPAINGNFAPSDGSIRITAASRDALDDDTSTIDIAFTEDTPSDGIVEVSINGGRSFEYDVTQ